MRHRVSVIAAAILIVSASAVAAEQAADAKKDIAAKYFSLLFTGEAAKAMEMCDVPFSWDRKTVIQTRDELAKMHQQVADKKGKRAVPEFTIEPTDKAPKLDAAIVVKYSAYRVTIDKEIVDVYVSEGGKVVGFSD